MGSSAVLRLTTFLLLLLKTPVIECRYRNTARPEPTAKSSQGDLNTEHLQRDIWQRCHYARNGYGQSHRVAAEAVPHEIGGSYIAALLTYRPELRHQKIDDRVDQHSVRYREPAVQC